MADAGWNPKWKTLADELAAGDISKKSLSDLPAEMTIELVVTSLAMMQGDRAARDAAGGFNKWSMTVLGIDGNRKYPVPTYKFEASLPQIDTGMWFWSDTDGVRYARPLDGKVYGVGLLKAKGKLDKRILPVLRHAARTWTDAETPDRWRARVEAQVNEAFGVDRGLG